MATRRTSRGSIASFRQTARPGALENACQVDYNRVKQQVVVQADWNLKECMQQMCNAHNVADVETHCLLFAENYSYVTEEDVPLITPDTEILLRELPEIRAKKYVEKLNCSDQVLQKKVVFDLRDHVKEVKFVEEFLKFDGLLPMFPCIIQAKERSLAYSLAVLAEVLTIYKLLSKESQEKIQQMPTEVVHKAFRCTIPAVLHNELGKSSYLQIANFAFSVCHLLLENKVVPYEQVEDLFSYDAFIEQLGEEDIAVKENVLWLIIALYLNAPQSQKRKISSELNSRKFGKKLVTLTQKSGRYNQTIAHQLYIIQYMMIRQNREKLVNYDESNPEHVQLTTNIMQNVSTEFYDYWDACGLPAQFTSKYSVFGLELLEFLSKKHYETFNKFLVQQNTVSYDKRVPLGQLSIILAEVLAQHFQIEKDITFESTGVFYTFMFSSDHPMKELYRVLLQCSIECCTEMSATREDMRQVASTVMMKFETVLNNKNKEMPSTFDSLKNSISSITLESIVQSIKTSVENYEKQLWKQTSGPVNDLRVKIRKETQQHILKQKHIHMINGCNVKLVNRKGRNPRFMKLSANKKTFGLLAEGPDAHSLSQTIIVRNIANLNAKTLNVKKGETEYAFSITFDDQSTMDIIVPSKKYVSVWVDGLLSLISKPPIVDVTIQEIDSLVELTLQARLSKLENIEIPTTPPSIPKPPPDFNFCT